MQFRAGSTLKWPNNGAFAQTLSQTHGLDRHDCRPSHPPFRRTAMTNHDRIKLHQHAFDVLQGFQEIEESGSFKGFDKMLGHLVRLRGLTDLTLEPATRLIRIEPCEHIE